MAYLTTFGTKFLIGRETGRGELSSFFTVFIVREEKMSELD